MTHITPSRFKELKDSPLTLEEDRHTEKCDYCCLDMLLCEDPDEYQNKPYPIWDRRYGQPKPMVCNRPKD